MVKMSIVDILDLELTGEPLKDMIVIAILFIVFYTFYRTIFEAVFSIFKKN